MQRISKKANAQMAELVDALVSNTSGFTSMPVRSRLWVQQEKTKHRFFSALFFYFPFGQFRCISILFPGKTLGQSGTYKPSCREMLDKHLHTDGKEYDSTQEVGMYLLGITAAPDPQKHSYKSHDKRDPTDYHQRVR